MLTTSYANQSVLTLQELRASTLNFLPLIRAADHQVAHKGSQDSLI
jgi:hypothetical protein